MSRIRPPSGPVNPDVRDLVQAVFDAVEILQGLPPAELTAAIVEVMQSRRVSHRPTLEVLQGGLSRDMPDTRQDKAIRLHERGYSYRKIAEHMGVSHTTARRWCVSERVVKMEWTGTSGVPPSQTLPSDEIQSSSEQVSRIREEKKNHTRSTEEEMTTGVERSSGTLVPLTGDGYPLRTGSEFWVNSEVKAQWDKRYGRTLVNAQLKLARQWLIDNPDRRKTGRGMRRFLGAWLANAAPGGRYAKEEPPGQQMPVFFNDHPELS